MIRLPFRFAWFLSLTAACTEVPIDLQGRPCEAGDCLSGYDCHPELDRCVVPFLADCGAGPANCPSQIRDADPCPSAGSFVPCVDGLSDCSAGCRTCLENLQWSACTTPAECQLGAVWSCSTCEDDCRTSVAHATYVACVEEDGKYACTYEGVCHPGFLDVDDDQPGCECTFLDEFERCDGVDNDCDGLVDQDFPGLCPCDEGQSVSCDAGLGQQSGTSACQADQTWGPCVLHWHKRITLRFDNTTLSEPVDAFPLLVVLDSSRINYDDVAANGADLLFVDADGAFLPHEIEQWNPSGSSYLWVGVPRIEAAPAEDWIWMYYGYPDAADTQDPAGVWAADFAGVWHLAESAPGVGNSSTYLDSTGHDHHGTDNVAATDKPVHIGLAQVFDPGDTIDVPHTSLLSPADAITLEMWTQIPSSIPSSAWARRARVQLSESTPYASFQVEVQLDSQSFDYGATLAGGDDLRFHDNSGNSLPYWIETWDPIGTSIIWVKVLVEGTSSFWLYFANQAASPESNAFNTLESGGLWSTFWHDDSGAHPEDSEEMDAHFAALSYDGNNRDGWGPVGSINCEDNNCNPFGNDDDYSSLFEGWLAVTQTGQHEFATNSDDASDVHVGGTGWKHNIGVPPVAIFYGGHTFFDSPWWGESGVIELGVGLHRYQYRHEEGHNQDGYRAAYRPPGSEMQIIPSEVLYHRKRADPQSLATVGASEPLGALVQKRDSYGLRAQANGLVGTINDQVLVASVDAGWHYLALTYNGTAMQLYADGARIVSQSYDAPIAGSTSDLRIGDLAGSLLDQAGSIDEVRISTTDRTASWIAAQALSMSRQLTDYGSPETVD